MANVLRAKFLHGDFPQADPMDVPFELGRRSQQRQTVLSLEALRQAVRSCPQKTGAAASGSRLEHWQVLLVDDGAMAAVHRVLDDLVQGMVPGGRLGEAAAAFLVGILTPLAKPNGDVRPIAAPEALRRLMARAVTLQFRDRFAASLEPLPCAIGLPGGSR